MRHYSGTRNQILCLLTMVTLTFANVNRTSQGQQIPATAASGNSTVTQSSQPASILEQIPPYLPNPKFKPSGVVNLSGSTTMYELGVAWADKFKKFHQSIEFTGEANGSESAIKTLSADPSVIAGVSRPVNEQDLKVLQSGNCKDPAAFVVALDALAVVVHEDNSIASISPQQIATLLSADSPEPNWQQLGGETGQKIELLRRNSGSGTATFIDQMFLGDGASPRAGTRCESTADIFERLAKNKNAIGFASLGVIPKGLRAVPLAIGEQTVAVNEAEIRSGNYPLMRPLILIADRDQMKNDGGLRSSIISFVLSREGQSEVIKYGFFPLGISFNRQQLDLLPGESTR